MKNTELVFVIDKSGSMAHLAGDTIGGFNGFIESQKRVDGKATLTTILFDTSWKILHDGIDIHEVKPMTTHDYMAGGGTAMLDAIGEVINRVQDRHDDLGAEKPDNVLFVITTDGEENSSRKFNKSQIEKMIKHQTNGHGWEFMFLGANMDAVKEAASIGINANRSVTYDYSAKGIDTVYATMDCLTSAYRTGDTVTASASLSKLYDACSVEATNADSITATIDNFVNACDNAIATKADN